jgi:hypothetical protein
MDVIINTPIAPAAPAAGPQLSFPRTRALQAAQAEVKNCHLLFFSVKVRMPIFFFLIDTRM